MLVQWQNDTTCICIYLSSLPSLGRWWSAAKLPKWKQWLLVCGGHLLGLSLLCSKLTHIILSSSYKNNYLFFLSFSFSNYNNCYSGIIKANYSLLDLVLAQIHTPCYKTYIDLKLKLSNKCLKLLVEVASAIPPANCSNYCGRWHV